MGEPDREPRDCGTPKCPMFWNDRLNHFSCPLLDADAPSGCPYDDRTVETTDDAQC